MCQLQLYTHSMNTSLHYCDKAHTRGWRGGVGGGVEASGGSIKALGMCGDARIIAVTRVLPRMKENC